jgi:heme A synthase
MLLYRGPSTVHYELGSLHSLTLCILCSLCMCQYVLFECVPKLSQLGDLRIVVQVAVLGVASKGMSGSPVALHTLPHGMCCIDSVPL